MTSFTVVNQVEQSDFGIKIETFLEGFETDFEKSPERYLNSEYNDLTLETKTNSMWNKTLTLKSRKTFKNHYNQTVKQRLFLGFHNFENAEKCNEAFVKIMDCLGDCQKINWGEEKKALKTTPFIYIKTEREIVFCKIFCEHENNFWITFKERFETEFKTKKYKIITAGCGGPLAFKENNK